MRVLSLVLFVVSGATGLGAGLAVLGGASGALVSFVVALAALALGSLAAGAVVWLLVDIRDAVRRA